MTAWIMSIVGAICLTILLDVLLEEGETKKYVKGIVSLIILSVIISPLPQLLSNNGSISSFVSNGDNTSEINLNFLYETELKQTEIKKTELISHFESLGILNVNVTPHLSFGDDEIEINQIIVDCSNSVITQDFTNINIKEMIREKVANKFSVQPQIVNIIGDV